MFNLTPNYVTIIPARDRVQLPEVDIASLIGGWHTAQSELRKGNMKMQANEERLLGGAASAPLTGAGIFIGKDGTNYEFRAGDPTGNYFHYDGTDIAFVGGSLSVGTNAWHVDSSGNMWWGSSATYAGATIKISATGTIAALAGTLGSITAATITGATFKTATTGARIEMTTGAANAIAIYPATGTTNKSSITGLTAELRLRMEQAGGYVTLYAQNDVNSAIEVLRADGDAGVSISNNLPFTAHNIVIDNTGTTKKSLDINQTNASSTQVVLDISLVYI